MKSDLASTMRAPILSSLASSSITSNANSIVWSWRIWSVYGYSVEARALCMQRRILFLLFLFLDIYFEHFEIPPKRIVLFLVPLFVPTTVVFKKKECPVTPLWSILGQHKNWRYDRRIERPLFSEIFLRGQSFRRFGWYQKCHKRIFTPHRLKSRETGCPSKNLNRFSKKSGDSIQRS